ncbi:MAG: NADH-quinone oxidoreductase subunit N [Deltaproteobacteria bacterium]|nr:NADH-quinone oxidoreductase subunit N [Deltaproteobacteria bacterium]
MMPLALDILLACILLLVFVVDLLLPAEDKRGIAVVACAGALITLAASFVLDVQGTAFGGAFVNDAVALYLKRVFLAAGALGVLIGMDHADRFFPRRQGEYHLLVLSSLLGMTLLASARELIFIVVSFELMSMPLYVLAAMRKSERSAEAALKLYLVGAVSSVVTLYGLSLLFAAAGTTMLSGVTAAAKAGNPMVVPGLVITLAGLGFKIGVVPFHMWVPDTYEGAPTPFVAFLSVAPKAAGFAALIRIFIEALPGQKATWAPAVIVMCVITMVVGNVLAIPQTSVKRLLAYSGIGQMGTMLLGIGLVTPDGLGMLLFYLVAYLFTNMGAFAVASVIEDASGSDHLDAFKGLSRRNPGLAMAMLLFLLSLGGIPFVAGFWAKVGVFVAAYRAGYVWIVVLGAVLAVVSVFYYMRVARSIYMERPVAGTEGRVPMALSMKAAVTVACVGVVGVGLYPAPFVETALAAARALMG